MLTLRSLILACIAGLAAAPGAHAQNLFTPIVDVNEDVVTAYELDQRQLFLRVISPANSGRDRALEDLIEDRLRQQAVETAGFELSEQDVEAGMEEFAGRANLTLDEFLNGLGQEGVAPETFRDFVSVGLAWRDLVRARFGSRVQISEAAIDRALSAASIGSGVRVLLSEIIIPAQDQEIDEVLALAEEISRATSEAEFSSYARQFSATASRDNGGRLSWSPLANLPATLRPIILALGPGDVTGPIPIPNAVALFQLRAIEETGTPTPEYSAIEYAQYLIPGGRTEATLAEAAQIASEIDVCDDLYGIAQGQPEEFLSREILAPADIPQNIALELAKLDNHEVSTALTTADGSALIFLMMCGRTTIDNEEVSRDDIASRLRQERLQALADNWLEELRADARIVVR